MAQIYIFTMGKIESMDFGPSWEEKTEKTGVRLGMLRDGALQNGDLNKFVDVFYGSGGRYLSVYADPNDPMRNKIAVEHEEHVRQRYLRKHLGASEEDYQLWRKERRDKSRSLAIERVNERYEKAVAIRFDVPRDPMAFANSRLGDAGQIMSDTAEELAPNEPNLHPRNEAVLIPESPADTVIKLGLPDSEVDPVLKTELVRQQVLAFIAAEHKRLNGKQEAEKKLRQIHDLLSDRLFKLPQGRLVRRSHLVTFNDITNGVLAIDGEAYDNTSGSGHEKQISLLMRPIKDSHLYALVEVDKKEIGTSVKKAIKKAVSRSEKGEDDLVTAGPDVIQDTHRMQIVIDGNIRDRYQLTNRIKRILENSVNQEAIADKESNGNPKLNSKGRLAGRVLRIEMDSSTNGYASQAKVNFDRLLVYIDGIPAPIEIKIVTLKDYLDDTYHIGEIDPNTGGETAKPRAHILYENRRDQEVAEYILGDRVNDPENRDAIEDRQQQIVGELLVATR